MKNNINCVTFLLLILAERSQENGSCFVSSESVSQERNESGAIPVKRFELTFSYIFISFLSKVKTNRQASDIMRPSIGIIGAIVLAVGGFILFSLLFTIAMYIRGNMISSGLEPFSFIGFLFFGIGLWLIVQSGRAETKQTLVKVMKALKQGQNK